MKNAIQTFMLTMIFSVRKVQHFLGIFVFGHFWECPKPNFPQNSFKTPYWESYYTVYCVYLLPFIVTNVWTSIIFGFFPIFEIFELPKVKSLKQGLHDTLFSILLGFRIFIVVSFIFEIFDFPKVKSLKQCLHDTL